MSEASPQKLQAVVLAAGEGRRYALSGGIGYKQLSIVEGEPLIRRQVRLLLECENISQVTIVLGTNKDCCQKIEGALNGLKVTVVNNPLVPHDNNLVSLSLGLSRAVGHALVVEADCVFGANDIHAMTSQISRNEVRWANIGGLAQYDSGGVIESVQEPHGSQVKRIHVFDSYQFERFKHEGRDGVKMFGLTTFSFEAVNEFHRKVACLDDIRCRYFHDVFCESGSSLLHTSVQVSADCYSFNTVKELESGKEKKNN